jgi:hypothetical protein
LSPQTPTLPPNDRGMWRRLVARTHPDSGGTHELFIWTMATRDVVCGGELGTETPRRASHEQHSRGRDTSASSAGERIPFQAKLGTQFVALKNRALAVAEEVEEPYKILLYLLVDCAEAEDGPLFKMQQQGATYRSLAAITYRAGMSKSERVRWYRVAEGIPLSQRHAGHILSQLQREAA